MIGTIFLGSVLTGGVIGTIVGCIYVRHIEKKNWNNGNCPICNEPWRCFDVDSQGGRMYKCSNHHYCDITYRVDK